MLDTGPLLAYFDRRENNHSWVAQAMARIQPPLITCEAVLAECCFLFQRSFPDGVRRLDRWREKGLLKIRSPFSENTGRPFNLMHRYDNLPMSFADACLVSMIESGLGERVFTLDGHFRIYRHSGRRVVPVLMPDG